VRIDELVLFSADVPASVDFVEATFPAAANGGDDPARVRFVPGTRVDRADNESPSAFWKFSIFTDAADSVAASLAETGCETSQPGQFLDIGYLCHLREPGGNEVELVQRRFSPPLDPPSPTGFFGRDTLGLITLRVTDLASTLRMLIDGLGMKHLVTMVVDGGRPDPFALEFLAFTDDEPPETDRTHVANREWLYQRPYTVIELQHGPALQVLGPVTNAHGVGLSHISIVGRDMGDARSRLAATGVDVTVGADGSTDMVTSDGHRFVLRDDVESG